MKKISIGTITRTVLLIIALLNIILRAFGKDTLPFTEEEVGNAISTIFMAITAISAWWKNNSFSTYAQKADEILKQLKSGEGESED